MTLTDSDLARFWDKVDKRGADECWPWTASHFSTGYPLFWLRGHSVGGHRVACALRHGLAAGRSALHSCDNRGCVNPRHLRWGTSADNMRDRSERGRAPIGEQHGIARLTEDDVRAIRTRYSTGEGTPSLGRAFGVSTTTAWQIVNRKAWRHVA